MPKTKIAKLNVVDKDGKIIHTILTSIESRQMGIVYALCVFLYTIPPETRDAALEYIMDSASTNIDDLANALGCRPATIRRRFDRARSTFRQCIKNGCISARHDLFVDLVEEEPEVSSADPMLNTRYYGITNLDANIGDDSDELDKLDEPDELAEDSTEDPPQRRNWRYGIDSAKSSNISSDEEDSKNS